MNPLRARVGTRLRALRRAKRLSQEQLAERAGLSYKFVGEVERGQANPTLDTLQALGQALGVEVTELFGTVDARSQSTVTYPLPVRQLLRVREALDSLEDALGRATREARPPRRRGVKAGR